MTLPPSQSSDRSADSAGASAAEKGQRRLRILAALDIDIWEFRPALEVGLRPPVVSVPSAAEHRVVPASAPTGALVQPPALQPPIPSVARTGAGPAAARALLEESTRAGSAWETASLGPEPVAAEGVADASEALPAELAEPLDLWCLSSSHGVLLARHAGLSPPAQRLLNDILQSATRAIGSRLQLAAKAGETVKPSRAKLQTLRFTWPPAEQAGNQATGQDTARALRGFLNRQLKNAKEPVLLFVADDIAAVLESIELSVEGGRRLALDTPETLMSDSTMKRALWRTLSEL